MPAFFVCDISTGVGEGEEEGVAFVGTGAAAGVTVAASLSELPDCRASSAERFTASTVTTSVAPSTARESFFALPFMVLLLTECAPTGTEARWNSGMMAKKAGEVNMEEGQICWPQGQGVSVPSGGSNTTVRGRLVPGDPRRDVSRRRRHCGRTRPIRPGRGGPGPARTPGLRAPAPGKDWWLGAEIRCGDPV